MPLLVLEMHLCPARALHWTNSKQQIMATMMCFSCSMVCVAPQFPVFFDSYIKRKLVLTLPLSPEL